MRASRLVTNEPDDLFEIANLSPALTGLPMVVWIGARRRSAQRESRGPLGACTLRRALEH
jgi:hypothetical protein